MNVENVTYEKGKGKGKGGFLRVRARVRTHYGNIFKFGIIANIAIIALDFKGLFPVRIFLARKILRTLRLFGPFSTAYANGGVLQR